MYSPWLQTSSQVDRKSADTWKLVQCSSPGRCLKQTLSQDFLPVVFANLQTRTYLWLFSSYIFSFFFLITVKTNGHFLYLMMCIRSNSSPAASAKLNPCLAPIWMKRTSDVSSSPGWCSWLVVWSYSLNTECMNSNEILSWTFFKSTFPFQGSLKPERVRRNTVCIQCWRSQNSWATMTWVVFFAALLMWAALKPKGSPLCCWLMTARVRGRAN